MNKELAGLSTQERKIISYFTANEKEIIGIDDLLSLHPCPRGTANQILSRLTRKGWLQRLKRGVYTIVPITSSKPKPVSENAWPLAMDFFRPAFISGWSAAEYWDLTEQIFNTISVVTMTPQRVTNQVIGGIRFRTRVIIKKKFFGTITKWFGSKVVEIADPNRLVIDILDLPRFGGGAQHTVDIMRNFWHSKNCDPDLLLKYALRFQRGSLFKRLGFLTEKFGTPVPEGWIRECQRNISTGISNLDPDGPASGKIISKWNLRVNIRI